MRGNGRLRRIPRLSRRRVSGGRRVPVPLSRNFSLGPCLAPLRGVDGEPMRLKMDVLKTVFYIGTHAPGGSFAALGTAFLLVHGRMPYLVTAKLVAAAFGDDPVQIRMNHSDGRGRTYSYDPLQTDHPHLRCFFHPSHSVDVAVLPFLINIDEMGVDVLILNSSEAVDRLAPQESSPVGCGDLCYAVGLFSLAPGSKKNLPVIHTGNIARIADRDELIPQRQPNQDIVGQEGYLVQLSNLSGLSGAPVFIRSAAVKLENGE